MEDHMRIGTLIMIVSLIAMIGLPLYYAMKYAG